MQFISRYLRFGKASWKSRVSNYVLSENTEDKLYHKINYSLVCDI